MLAVVCAAILMLAAGGVCNAQGKKSKDKGAQQPPPQAPPTAPPVVRQAAPPKVGIDTNPQLFATMCALWAAGYYSGGDVAALPPAWAEVAQRMLDQKGPATDALRQYYQQHEHNNRAATLSRFISLAMVAGPPPEFEYTFRHEDLPPDVLNIEDFNEVLAKFYKEAQLDTLWARMEPAYRPAASQMQGPLTQIVLKTTGYLREVLRTESPRTFSVYIEPLAGVSIHSRSYGDHYVVVTRGGEIPMDQIRHAFLHFLLDTLPVRYNTAIVNGRPLLNIAARAPRLPREYRDDFTGFYTECLIKAVELELDRMTAEQRMKAIGLAEADGFVLVRPLVAQLEKFQQSEPAMTYYFPDLAKGIDVAAEIKRLQTVQFAPAEETTPVDAAAAEALEKEQMLQQGERLMAGQKPVDAQSVFEKVEERWPGTPRAVYGLAIAAVMQGKVDRAKELLVNLTHPTPVGPVKSTVTDPLILAWAHVYLGRIDDLEDNRDQAIAEYRAALAVQGAPDSAKRAAQTGVDKAYQRPGGAGKQPDGSGRP